MNEMLSELKAWLNREPQAGQAVSILAKYGPALLAACEGMDAFLEYKDEVKKCSNGRKAFMAGHRADECAERYRATKPQSGKDGV